MGGRALRADDIVGVLGAFSAPLRGSLGSIERLI